MSTNASIRVLLVEDEALDALQVARSLRPHTGTRERYDLRCTRTLTQGLKQLGRDPVDVVLLDLHLPDSDADDTVARLRALDRRTPLVVFTACEDEATSQRAFEAGADDFLVKGDVEAPLLRQTIRRAIGRRQGVVGPSARPSRGLGAADRSVLHHLKNVQTCIVGNAQILERELPSSGFLHERIASLLGAAHTATGLIQELADGVHEASGPVDLSELVRGSEDLLRAVVPHEIELRLRLDRGLPRVRGRREALKRVVLELVVNACEAMGREPGVIEIRTGRAALAAADRSALIAPAGIACGPCVWLEVRDDGPGVDLGAIHQLFEPGFSTKGHRRGHGLVDVRTVLAQHRGALRISSPPGAGAVFRLLFPLGGAAA